MDDLGKKCRITENHELGRYLCAKEDIKAGETVLLDHPVLIMPTEGVRRCANCYKLTQAFCRSCKVFSLCESCTQHNAFDCRFLAQLEDVCVEDLRQSVEVYGLLKCLLLNENAQTKHYFAQLLQLEAHQEERRGTDIWKEYGCKVIKPMLDSKLTQHLNKDRTIDEELLQQLLGAFDVNCFEMRAPDAGSMRGLYLHGLILAHNCLANTVLAIDKQYQMKIYANRDIKKDELLNYCYTNPLLGTDERRQHLKIGKYFNCTCQRCEDPTELGSHMSSLLCSSCASNNREGGFIVKKNTKTWQCLKCDFTLTSEYVESLLDRAKEEIFHAQEDQDVRRFEMVMAKLSRILHPNHFLMVDIKQNIAAILRTIIMNPAHRPGRRVYERKVHLCQEVLKVLTIIQPGISRLKAIALYELCNSFAELSRLRYSEHELSELELISVLQKSEIMLREAIRQLLYEPVDTPEGELTKNMLKELKDMQNDMKLLEQKRKEN